MKGGGIVWLKDRVVLCVCLFKRWAKFKHGSLLKGKRKKGERFVE